MFAKKSGMFVAALVSASLLSLAAQAQDTIKIAYVDPLSGGMANVGDAGLKHYQFMADRINAAGGVMGKKLEIVAYDGKLNPQESLIQVQKAIDAGIRFVTQGNGSSVAAAMSDFVAKHNSRNPDKAILYLNYAAVDPALTNDKCNYWHFRFDAHSDIKMAALTSYLVDRPDVKKVYLINQDYSFGRAVSAAAREMLKAKRPDIEIVGDEFHPLAKVNDFLPYVAKIKTSGAQAVITGNWGNDISLLIKAADEAGLNTEWFTYYGGGLGTPSAIGKAGKDRVKQITEWHNNIENAEMDKFVSAFNEKYPDSEWYYLRVRTTMEMLAKAIEEAKSTEPAKVAAKLEGMTYNTLFGEVFMRKDDHQLFQPMYISTFTDGMKNDVENTGLGFKTDAKVEAKDTVTPTTCKMERPS